MPPLRDVTICIAVCAAILCAAPAAAQSLSHRDAINAAVESNVPLLIDRLEREIATLSARESRRPYLPVVFVQPQFSASQSAVRTTSAEDPEVLRQSRVDAGAGLRWDTRWGTSLSLRANTTPWYSNFAPTPLTSLEASLNQNLLRGAFRSGTLLDVADLEVELQRQRFITQLNDLLVRVDAAYWELSYAQSDVDLKVLSRDRANSQFEDTRENIARGLLAPGDIFVVEENLVIFEEQLLRARESLKLAQLRLARLLQRDGADLVAADPVDAPQAAPPTTADAVATALRENPTITAHRIAVRQAEATHAFDRNQARPVLDLAAALGLNGHSDAFGPSWSEALTGDNPVFRIGLYFEVPLVSGPHRARVKRARTRFEQAELQLQQAELDLDFQVRELLTQLDARISTLELAQRRIELAENKLSTEQDKYERGLSTLTDLVRFQRDVDTAQSSERRARVDVQTLRARLASAQGTLYAELGVEVR